MGKDGSNRFVMPVSFVSRDGRVVIPSGADFKGVGRQNFGQDSNKVPYLGELPEVVPGVRRAVAVAASAGCFVVLRVRTSDRVPDKELISAISQNSGLSFFIPGEGSCSHFLTNVPTRQKPVDIRVENGYYEISMGGVPRHELIAAMEKVNGFGIELLAKKETAQGLAGEDTENLIARIRNFF